MNLPQIDVRQTGARRRRLAVAALLLVSLTMGGRGDDGTSDPPEAQTSAGAAKLKRTQSRVSDQAPRWLDSLARGTEEARKLERPMFLIAKGDNCRFCLALNDELEKPELERELRRWTLVRIDVDESPGDARLMAVDAIPALRILTPAGRLVSSQEGFVPADTLTAWLKDQFEAASVAPPAVLSTEGPPDSADVRALIDEFKNRDPAIREAAVRRLMRHPEQAARRVASAFATGNLAARLTALELLQEWRAPIDGFDPWRPESLTAARLKALSDWGESADHAGGLLAREGLSEEELRSIGEMIDRMLVAPADESRAIRERLARYGRLLLSHVYERLREVATDADRERLTALRYRLVAPEGLALTWSGGLERLAAADPETRLRAADELLRRVTSAEEPLLLELFSDPAPLVRELSLRALHEVGGSNARSALLRLLDDPEPNVRAAVLKQLAQSPPQTIVPRIAEFTANEADSDLVVHAIRVLREAKGESAAQALMKLLTHESWQVRAEAADALGQFVDRYATKVEPLHADIYSAMVDLLADSDGFVLSRAVTVLQRADLIAAVEPLAQAAESHPELARDVIRALAQGNKQRRAAVVHLRRFTGHNDARLRAAAIGALCGMEDEGIEDRLPIAFRDSESDVRQAAATGFFQMLESHHPHTGAADEFEVPVAGAGPAGLGVFGGFLRALIGGSGAARKMTQPATTTDPAPDAAPVNTDRAEAQVNGEGKDGTADNQEIDAKTRERIDSAASTTDASPDGVETELADIRNGKRFNTKWFALADDLLPMLSQPAAEERLSAALPLAALGRDHAAIPELQRLARDQRHLLPRTAHALPWLLNADRERLFAELWSGASSADDVRAIAGQLATIDSKRAGEQLWSLLEADWIDAAAAEEVKTALLQFYFPAHPYNPQDAPARARKRAVSQVSERAKSGPHWRRIAALAILLPLEQEAAAEIARALVDDTTLADAARADALQILLTAEPEELASKDAMAHLAGAFAGASDVSLTYLVQGAVAIGALREGRFRLLSSYDHSHFFHSTSQPIVPVPPAGLRPEPLLPLVDAANRRTAAQAGYLLALLDRHEGLAVLIDYWRAHAQDDVTWMRLVYRAIARLDEGAHVPVLREIYGRLSDDKNRSSLGEFYWTLRSMTHPEILPLRSQIRKEVGMDQLR
ncbi:MAG: HEAT repeat domain-containing protein [Planctomycetaceae bacterium]